MEAKVAKTLMEAYASVYDQPEQINELKVAPDYDGPPIKGPSVGDLPPKKKPEKPPYKGPRVKGGPGARKPIKVGLPMKREDVDVFDIVKGYLMSEHDLTEEQAMKVMLELEDEHRDAILEAYVVTLADKRGNTKAYQNYKAGMKSKVDGKPLYVAAPHLKGV
jgi:hypothetical protein|tara:strand:+ start:839 stop:1327 length:489 start_codon:yes stop_codon:yes gene_type:complete